jgi:ribosomal protein S18 acetylase RimI-like enzyme
MLSPFLQELGMSEPAPHDVVIRRCRPEDAEALLTLWRQAGATVSATDTPEDVRRAITASPAWVLVATMDGQLAGSVIGSFDGWRGNLYRLAVHPDHRRRGIARALVRAAERRLAGEGARRMTALVEKDHPQAVAFWQAVGYQVDERMVRYFCNLSGAAAVVEADPDSPDGGRFTEPPSADSSHED